MSISQLLFIYLALHLNGDPLGCIEDENKILLNFPFFTIPVGKRVDLEEICNYKPSLTKEALAKIRPFNNALILKKDNSITIKKGETKVKRFYPTEDLSPYPGLFLDEKEIGLESKITLYLKAIKGDGLFLLVLRGYHRVFARQIVIEGVPKCPLKASIPIEDFFEIPYKTNEFSKDRFAIELYILNFNEIEWMLLGFEIE